MATFQPGVTDQFPQQSLYTPDYNFLNQVYSTEQSRYDRGFSMVKNLYSSMLNKSVSSGDNEQFRADMFKKLQGQIKSISNADLTNSANVLKAQSIFDPLAKDRELLFDMGMTSSYQSEMQKAESFRNSTDPKQRALYNDIAKEYIQNAQQSLAGSKRGDGSIFQAKRAEFVPFEDVNGFIQERLGKDGLKVKTTRSINGYLVTTVNGHQMTPDGKRDTVVEPFTRWAAMQMGNRFDKQLQVTASVMIERQVKQIQQETGLPRSQAITELADKLKIDISTLSGQEAVTNNNKLSEVNTSIKKFQEAHPNGIPESLIGEWEGLMKQKTDFTEAAKSSKQEVEMYGTATNEYMASNLTSHLANHLKKKTAYDWANTYAETTREVDLKPDQVVLQQRQEAFTAKQNDLNRRNSMDMTKMRIQASFELDAAKSAREAKKDGPSETIIGPYTDPNQTRTASDVLMDTKSENFEKAYDGAFNVNYGMFNAIVGNNNRSTFLPAFNALKEVANGTKKSLNPEELKALKSYAAKLGMPNMVTPKTAATASTLVHSLIDETYTNFTRYVKLDRSGKAVANNAPALKGAIQTYNAFKGILKSLDSDTKMLSKISDAITYPNGQLKPDYKDAKIIGYDSRNRPLYDISSLTTAQKTELDNILPTSYKSQQRVTGTSTVRKNVNSYEFPTLLNPNSLTKIVQDGKDVTNDYRSGKAGGMLSILSQLSPENLKEVFGGEMDVNYSGSGESATITLRVAPGNKAFAADKNLKGATGVFQITVPKSTIQSIPGLGSFKGGVEANTPNYSSLGVAEDLMKNPMGTVSSHSTMDGLGFSYQLTGVEPEKGQYGVLVSFTIENENGRKERKEMMINNLQKGSAASLDIVEKFVEQQLNKYTNTVSTQQKSKHINEKLVEYNFDALLFGDDEDEVDIDY